MRSHAATRLAWSSFGVTATLLVVIERQQLKWFAYAATCVGVLGPLAVAFWYQSILLQVAFAVAINGLPIAAGIAILRHRLYDIDIVINRTLVYGLLTITLLLVYFGGVAAIQAVFRALTGQEQQPQLVIVVSTLVIAALFDPLRRRIQNFIDRSFYRRKYDAARTLQTFSIRLREEMDLENLSTEMISVVRETMQPERVSFWLASVRGKEGYD